MCGGRITNPDIPADCFDAFDSDEDDPDPIEDLHHATFECSGDATTRQMVSGLFPSHASNVSQVLSLIAPAWPNWIRMLRLNAA